MKKGAKVYIYVLSFHPRGGGVNIKLIFALRAAVFETQFDFHNFIFGHEILNLKKGAKVAYVLSFYPKASKVSLFSLYGQLLSKYGRFSKFPYLGMKSGI